MAKIVISVNSNKIGLTREGNHLIKLLQEPSYDPYLLYSRGYIKTDLSTYAWGENSWGQIGNNTKKIMSLPTQLSKNFNKISGSEFFTAGIDNQGKAWTWGYNDYGRLGTNSETNTSTPCAVFGNHTFCDVICGNESCSAFDNNKQLWSWGFSYFGILGANVSYLNNKSTPIAVVMTNVHVNESDSFFCKVDIGKRHALAIAYVYDDYQQLIGSKTFAWGHNVDGCFGNGGTGQLWGCPTKITALIDSGEHHDFFEIAVGYGGNYLHSLAIDQLGKAWSWGSNYYGQLGTNSTIKRSTPFAIYGDHTFCKVYGGKNNFSMATDNHGITWSWGYNEFGQLGINNKINKSTPIALYGNHVFCQISTGYNCVLAIDNNNKSWGWGYVNNLGINISTAMPSGSFDGVTHTFCKVFALGNSSFGIDNHAMSWAWGENVNYNLGDNSSINKSTPVAICGNHTFCEIAGNMTYIIGIDNNGKGWGWGNNTYGFIGIGVTNTTESTPIALYGNHTFCQISSGNAHNSAIDNHGNGWGWGSNYVGQVSSTPSIESTPFAIYGNHTFCKISSGYDTTVAIDNHGKGWGWGSNDRYQVGISYQGIVYSPTPVHGDHTFCHINVGYNCTLAIDNHGKGWGWGSNWGYGDAGVDMNTDTSTPVEISGTLKTFCKIMSGNYFSMAIDNHGKGWGWGYNNNGQLGINEITTLFSMDDILYSPRAICGNITFCQISLGNIHSIAIDNHGKGWSWGRNYAVQLGRTTYITTPVSITS